MSTHPHADGNRTGSIGKAEFLVRWRVLVYIALLLAALALMRAAG